MKILTLNTHSHLEENYLRKLACFVELALREHPDLIALQEVNQLTSSAEAELSMLEGMAAAPSGIPVRSDNHAAWIAYLLRAAGIPVSWAWIPVKLGYGRYDEGLALLSMGGSIADLDVVQLSRCSDYDNWKTRKALGVRIDGSEDWYYAVHFGWWDDAEEPFQAQWERLNSSISHRKPDSRVWLLGDFNNPAEVRGEGYDCILEDGWQDAWRMARQSGAGATVESPVDGWRDRTDRAGGLRIDQIWCSKRVPVRQARIVFDGKREPKISDHYGILLETE